MVCAMLQLLLLSPDSKFGNAEFLITDVVFIFGAVAGVAPCLVSQLIG